MVGCLSAAEIEQLVAGALGAEERQNAEAHLAECERCRRQAEQLRADDDLFGKIKQAYETQTTPPSADLSRPSRLPAADSIEGFELLREIHRGGQGVVYKAVQKATKRTVALKVLLEGPYASPRQRHRFEREIDLVASLQHPNIVTVYDSGVTHDGRHYFAMEYIHGLSLDAYLSDKTLSIDETLRLSQQICAAVNYAHQRGVIHRDLKPGNIRIDSNGTPHILDFGLAKAAGASLAEGAPVTVTGEFMGTLAYASPEQTQGDPNLIDIRTDVYSLGVILYEMLTGKYPYAVVGQMADVLRNISEAEPKRPSTIRRQINDEVETIVLTALAKDKERRYQSAAALADDIERYLAGEPIAAKRDSRLYVIRKTLVHYRRQVVGAALVLFVVSLAFGIGAYSWMTGARWREATGLVDDASLLIAQHSDLDRALELLDEALDLKQHYAGAYFKRGEANALLGLNAPLEKKGFFLRQAIQDCYEAHRAAGGDRLRPADSPHQSGGRAGLRSALLLAGNLSLLADERDDAEVYFALAEEVAPSHPASPEDGHTSPWMQVYDRQRDELIQLQGAISASPAALGMEPDWDATLRRALSSGITSLNPLRAKSFDLEIIELLFERLFRIEVTGGGALAATPNPVLIERVEVSEDRRAWEVTLQSGLTWHDGHPFTAEDVAFTWQQRGRDPGSSIESVEARGERRIGITFRELVATGPWELDFRIVPKHVFEQLGADADELFGQRPIGTGPYRWCPTSSKELVVLERWDGYAGPRPYFAQVEFQVLRERDVRLRALAEGQVDVAELSGTEFRWWVNGESFKDRVVKVAESQWAYEFVCWNAKGPTALFANAAVRRAMTHAMNLDRIVAQRFGGLYTRCTGIHAENSWMFNREVLPLAYDPDEAGRLLDEAGWKLPDDGGGVRQRNGRPFEFALLVPEESPDSRSLAHELQQDLLEVGVLMHIEVLPWPAVCARRDAGSFDAFIGRVRTSPHPDQERCRWTTNGSLNYGGYSCAAVDKLYEAAHRELDTSRHPEQYRRIQALVYRDQPYTFLWHRPTLLAVNRNLKGVKVGPLGVTGFYPGPRDWWMPAPTR